MSLPFDIDTFYQLRKEAYKTWDYVITDKLMYSCQNVDSPVGFFLIGYDETIAMNFRNRWWELLIQTRNGDIYCVIVEPIPSHPCKHIKPPLCACESQQPMLVSIREFLQQPQGVSTGIRCGIWLKRLNDLSGIIGNVLQESLNYPVRSIVILPENGKFSFVVGTGGRQESQLPCDVVKGRTKVVKDIPYDYSPTTLNRRYLQPINIDSLIRFVVSADREWFSVLPCADEVIERLQVIRRSVEFQLWPIEWVHMLLQDDKGMS